MSFCVLFSRSRGSSGRGREGDTEPDISQKEAIAMYGSDSAYWFYKISSCHLGGLIVSLGKTLAVAPAAGDSWLHFPSHRETTLPYEGEEPRHVRRRALTYSY